MHSCDNPACVNPDHLTAGTHRENLRGMVERNRSTRGERNYRSKLTTAAVSMIKKRLAAGESQSSLAREFGVAPVTVHWIAAGKTWGHVPPCV